MPVRMIWAEARMRVIGNEGRIPWHVPGEQAVFREFTTGNTVVMGRTTWESLPAAVRPLPERHNIVLTRQADRITPGAAVCHSADEAIAQAGGKLWVIGGQSVYAQFLPHAVHIVRTEIDLDVPGDTFAPAVGADWTADWGRWRTSDGVRWRVVQHRLRGGA